MVEIIAIWKELNAHGMSSAVTLLVVWYIVKYQPRTERAQNGLGHEVRALRTEINLFKESILATVTRQRDDHESLERNHSVTRERLVRVETNVEGMEQKSG